METGSGKGYKDEQQLELAPGFRFYPSDEELVTHYLLPKVFDNSYRCLAIGEADLNKCEPWDLPRKFPIVFIYTSFKNLRKSKKRVEFF